ncbi:replication protein [Chloroflexota bacterium]
MAKAKFRRIEYDLYEALMKAKLSGSIYQVLLVVIDFTIGYRKETAPIPLSTFQWQTRLSRVGVVKAIKNAERRKIISVDRFGVNPKKGASYSLNTDFSEWITGKQQLTSRLVNDSIPEQLTTVYQFGKHLTPATPIEINLNKTLKKKTPPYELCRGVHHPTPAKDMSLTLCTPKGKAEANSLTNGNTVLPGEDRATLESDLSAPGSPSRGDTRLTYQEQISKYLQEHSPASMKEISMSTGIKYTMVNLTLSNGKGKVFTNPQRGLWDLKDYPPKP